MFFVPLSTRPPSPPAVCLYSSPSLPIPSNGNSPRSVLEVTSLLVRLLPTLCPETVAHFYVGLRPARLYPRPSTAETPPSTAETPPSTAAASLSPRRRHVSRVGGSIHGDGFGGKCDPLQAPTGAVAGGGDARCGGGGGDSGSLGGGAAAVEAAMSGEEGEEETEEEEEEGREGEVTSAPWLFLSMFLPEPLEGLDFPSSTDGITGAADEDCGGDGGDDRGVDGLDSSSYEGYRLDGYQDRHRSGGIPHARQQRPQVAGGGEGHDTGSERKSDNELESRREGEGSKHALEPHGRREREEPKIAAASFMGAADAAAAAAKISLRFVCHVEVARLLAVTAMRVVGFGYERRGAEAAAEEQEEEAARVLLATGEAFFAAFNHAYDG